MQATALTLLRLEVSNLDSSTRWYRRALGLKIPRGYVPPSPGITLLEGGGLRLWLHAGKPARANQSRFGLFLATRREVRAWRSHLDLSDAMPGPVRELDGLYGFTVADPDRYVLEFCSAEPESSDL
jgi:Glyoxalase/Bleomycin resistance protein/Dioxygenase superfamily